MVALGFSVYKRLSVRACVRVYWHDAMQSNRTLYDRVPADNDAGGRRPYRNGRATTTTTSLACLLGSLLVGIGLVVAGIMIVISVTPTSARDGALHVGTFDDIVIGGGAAGCRNTEHLSRSGHRRVLLLEGGDYPDLEGDDERLVEPSDAPILEENFYARYFWQMAQQMPEQVVNLLTRQLTTGKVFGGGSTVNGLQVAYGSDENWDRLAAYLNEPRFNASAARQRFASMEALTATSPSGWRSGGGAWKMREIGLVAGVTSYATKMVGVLQELSGLSPLDDYNALMPGVRLGPFARWQLHMDGDYKRSSSYTAFLNATVLARPNLRVEPRAFVTRIHFDAQKRARSVDYVQDGRCYRAQARRSVVLAAGVFTSTILEHSGIGNATILAENQIPLVVDQPNVGEHMANHEVMSVVFSKNQTDAPSSDPNDIYESGAWLPTPNPDTPFFDSDHATERRIQIININTPGPVMVMAFINTQPQSRGYAHVWKGPDPLQTIRSSDAIMTDPAGIDRQTFRNILRNYARGVHDIFQDPGPNQDTAYALLDPPLATLDNDTLIDEWLFNNVRSHAHHWNGTARMGPNATVGVCDSQGRVFGVQGLYVCDVSLMPLNHDGNTVAPAIFLGDYVAENVLAQT